MFTAMDCSGRRTAYPVFKRGFDVLFAVLGLAALSPLGLIVAAVIKLSDRGPVFYRQRRIGLHGRPFSILKFRTMVINAEKIGPQVTQEKDPRITGIGRILRRTKLDELPQLWNVLIGEMSFVGPRPAVPRYVAHYTPEQRQLLNYKPGITDLATLVFRDEETLLRNAKNVEEFYVQQCIPRKFRLNLQYAERANLLEDIFIVLETLCPYWLGVVSTYVLALLASLWLAYELRFDFEVPPIEKLRLKWFSLVIVPLQLLALLGRKQFVGLLTYFDLPEIRQLASALGLAAAAQFLIWFVTDGTLMPARGIIVIDSIAAFVILSGTRLILRALREVRSSRFSRAAERPKGLLRVGIVGAGDLGYWLARQFNDQGKGNRHVEVFFDDDPDKWHKRLHDIPVAGMPECILDGSWSDKLDEVILAVPGAPPERMAQIKGILSGVNIRVRTLPSLEELLTA